MDSWTEHPGTPGTDRTATGSRRRRAPLVAALAVALLAGAFLAGAFVRPGDGGTARPTRSGDNSAQADHSLAVGGGSEAGSENLGAGNHGGSGGGGGEGGGQGGGGGEPAPEPEPEVEPPPVPEPAKLVASPDPVKLKSGVYSGSFKVTNAGDLTLHWEASSKPSVNLSSKSGDLAGGSSNVISFSIDKTTLPAGAFTFKIKVTGNGGTQYVDVNGYKPVDQIKNI